MRSFAFPAIAAVATLAVAGHAHAADMPEAPIYKAPEVEVVAAGWYLRGDIGFTNQQVDSLGAIEYDENPTFAVHQKSFDASPLFALGVGYQFNDWFRMDVTGEYRSKASFRGFDTYDEGQNFYEADKSEWTFLVNAYVDLGTWYGITPFIGAGIGTSRNTISDFTDIDPYNAGAIGIAGSHSEWDFAWALYAGLAYQVTPGFTIEFAYRYISLGDAQSGDPTLPDGSNPTPNNPLYFNDLTSHDLKVGFRWALGGGGTVVSKY